VLFVLGGLPNWGYHNYGYAPSGMGTVLLVILAVLLVTGTCERPQTGVVASTLAA
jgi:Protein of unknown function (DUF3309)